MTESADLAKEAASGTIRGWLNNLRDDMERVAPYPGYGNKILIQLALTYGLFCKSLAYSLVMDSWVPYTRYLLKMDASVGNDLYVVVRAPWAMKPIWAIISDVWPINGYRKRYMLLIAVVVALFGLIVPTLSTVGPNQVAFFFFFFVAGVTICDSMSQARYTELMKKAGNASIVSFVWFLINTSGFFAAYNLLLPSNAEIKEGVPDWRFKVLMMIAIPMALPLVVPAALNWLAEEQGDTGCRSDFAGVTKNFRIFILSAVTAGVAIGGVVIQLTTSPIVMFGITASWINGIFYGSGAILILVCCQICLPASIGVPAIYMFICKALYLNVGLIVQYWYTADTDCFVRANPPFSLGPGFENSYYQTVSGYGGTLASLLGVVVFDRTIQFWNVRKAFWLTTAVNALTTIFELSMLERWNQRLFGYDPDINPNSNVDRAFFILGAQAIDKLLDMLDSLPQTVLIGKLCPNGMEAQVFAILAALSNFGSNIAYVNGSIFAQVLGVSFEPPDTTAEPPREFWTCTNPMGPWGISHLGWLKLTATAFLPLATVPFTWICLPNINLSDDFHAEEDDVELTTAGFTERGGMNTAEFNAKKSGEENFWIASGKSSLIMGGRSGDMLM